MDINDVMGKLDRENWGKQAFRQLEPALVKDVQNALSAFALISCDSYVDNPIQVLDFFMFEMFENRNWHVIRIWECELKPKKRDALLAKIQPLLQHHDVFG